MRNGNGTVAVVFDIDGTLLTTGGAGATAWGLAFQEVYDVIGKHRGLHRGRDARP